MQAIRKSWDRIVKWYTINAPLKRLRLQTGAKEDDILKFEAAIHMKLPKDLRESYLIYNGSGTSSIFEYGCYLLSTDEIAQAWTDWQKLSAAGTFDQLRGTPEGPIKATWWNLMWIPFTHNGGGDHDCVDMDPDKGGKIGQIIEFSHEGGARKVSGQSFRAWLSSFAERLEAGKYTYDADGGSLVSVEDE